MSREKLVRDGIPALIADLGGAAQTRKVPHDERLPWLLSKLREECDELRETPCIEEAADVIEVLRAIADHLGLTWDEVERAREAKRAARGGFAGGVVMTMGE